MLNLGKGQTSADGFWPGELSSCFCSQHFDSIQLVQPFFRYREPSLSSGRVYLEDIQPRAADDPSCKYCQAPLKLRCGVVFGLKVPLFSGCLNGKPKAQFSFKQKQAQCAASKPHIPSERANRGSHGPRAAAVAPGVAAALQPRRLCGAKGPGRTGRR